MPQTETAPLPYPISDKIDVYKEGLSDPWFKTPDSKLRELFVCRYDVPVFPEDYEYGNAGEVCLTYENWGTAKLLADHPGCVFLYT